MANFHHVRGQRLCLPARAYVYYRMLLNAHRVAVRALRQPICAGDELNLEVHLHIDIKGARYV